MPTELAWVRLSPAGHLRPDNVKSTSGGLVRDEKNEVSPDEQKKESAEYQAPEVESVVTVSDLEREVQYAGFASGFKPPA